MEFYTREERYELRYISRFTGTEKICYPRSTEKKNEQLAICREKGIRVISCKKLYPFSTERNQHNFELIRNICFCARYDMDMADGPVDEAEYSRLLELEEKAERFFCLPLPVAWIPWEDWRDANELATMAIIHRQEACIANGRPDLVTYC